MRSLVFLMSALSLTLVGCGKQADKPSEDKNTVSMEINDSNVNDESGAPLQMSVPRSSMQQDVNEDINAISPSQSISNQMDNGKDMKITQMVRKALMDDSTLSNNAKNIKIITVNGIVTLRGVVNSNQEREFIIQKARSVSGVGRVSDQLEVMNR